MREEKRNKIKALFLGQGGIAKTSFLREEKVGSRDLTELMEEGFIKKIKTGYYMWIKQESISSIQIVYHIFPNGVISLYTAARLHGLLAAEQKQELEEFHITIPSTMLKPILPDSISIVLYYTSQDCLLLGAAESRTLFPDKENWKESNLLVYDLERTVCDFFRYPDRIKKEVAVDIIKEYMKKTNKNLWRLFDYAAKLRVKKYIKPYIEILM